MPTNFSYISCIDLPCGIDFPYAALTIVLWSTAILIRSVWGRPKRQHGVLDLLCAMPPFKPPCPCCQHLGALGFSPAAAQQPKAWLHSLWRRAGGLQYFSAGYPVSPVNWASLLEPPPRKADLLGPPGSSNDDDWLAAGLLAGNDDFFWGAGSAATADDTGDTSVATDDTGDNGVATTAAEVASGSGDRRSSSLWLSFDRVDAIEDEYCRRRRRRRSEPLVVKKQRVEEQPGSEEQPNSEEQPRQRGAAQQRGAARQRAAARQRGAPCGDWQGARRCRA